MDTHYEKIRTDFKDQQHRTFIGGMWEEIGALQFQFMVDQGLMPHHSLFDVGCGSLRGGVKFIDYLEAEKYYGFDINQTVVQVGIEKELNPAQAAKISPNQFRYNDRFEFNFDAEPFDFAIAVSLFTHLSQNKIRLCLNNLRPLMPNGKFYATFFETRNTDVAASQMQMDGVTTYAYRDPFHYQVSQIEQIATETGWQFEWIGDFNHPRNQKMALFY